MDQGLLPLMAGTLAYILVVLLWRGCLSPRKEEQEADERADELLNHLLTDEQRSQLAQTGYLSVHSPRRAGRVYRIPAVTGWVDIFDQGRLTMRLCAQPGEWLPPADVVLMHKLMIEASEEDYLRLANIRWMRPEKEVNMMVKCAGGEAARAGVYWSWSRGEFISVPKEGGRLAGGPQDRYVKVPLPLVLIVGPLMGLAFAIFLPLSGLLVLVPFLAGKLRGAVASLGLSAAHMAGHRLQPGVSYLQPGPRSSDGRKDGEGSAEEEQDGRLVDLAKEIAEKRWQEEK